MEMNMFFQEPTPDTSGYMIAGYVIAFIVMGLYVASIYLRSRNLNQDMTMLQELDKPTAAESQPKKQPVRSAGNHSVRPVTKKPVKK
jgi:hypothetical protein